MNAGVSSYAFGWGVAHGTPPVDEQALLAFARWHALRVIQIADNLPAHTWADGRLEALAAACRAQGMQLELGARGLTEAHLATYLRLCADCGAPLLRMVADAPGYEPEVDDLIALLRSAEPILEDAGVTLALENHDRFGARTLRHIADAVGSPRVGICLDTANSFGAGEGLAYVTEWLAEVTVNLHVKDVTIRRLPHLGGFTVEGTSLGHGCLPLLECVERVAAAGRCESAILEAWSAPAGTMHDTLAQERASADRSAAALRLLLAHAGTKPRE